MANLIRMIRFSCSLGEMHETYKILQSLKEKGELDLNPYLDNMRMRLKKKLMEEEEGLLPTSFTIAAEVKPRKYSAEGLGFAEGNNKNPTPDELAKMFSPESFGISTDSINSTQIETEERK